VSSDNPYDAFRHAVDKEAEVRTSSLLKGMGLDVAPVGEVELSDPVRLNSVWRTVFAALLLGVDLLVVVGKFFEVSWVRSQTSEVPFYAVFGGLLGAFVVVVIGWGSVKVKWTPREETAAPDGRRPHTP
jgi:uncharacterized membrane protein YdcZ (DUF606 family)